VIQHHKLGTGDAVAATACGFAKETFPEYSRGHLYRGTELSAPYVIICAGDTPALDPKMIQDFLTTCHRQKVRIGVIGMRHPYPTGYGRLVVDEQQRLSQIVEEKDASSQIKAITLCNSGVVFAERAFLFELLKQLDSNNAQNEYYLTDCFQIASRMGESALVFETDHYQSFAGVNRRDQLAEVERFLIQEKVSNLMSEGVSFHLPETCYLEDDVKIGCDSEIGANCSLLGKTLIGLDCRIGANSVLQNVSIPDGTILPPGTISIKE
jgi:bifunctional UDP-N-acetylglucosamine pyrophosphorylase/glucosamine-1-phosphate N-acetyltransferase